jgi:hypothetical protein
MARWGRRHVFVLLMGLAALGAGSSAWASDPCAGAPHCRVDGPLMSQVVQVNVTDSGGVTAFHGVRTTIRFTNLGQTPMALGYQDRSSRVSDDRGLLYKWSSKAEGIGRVTRDNADPQFQLAPGESREANFTNVLEYSVRHSVPGQVFEQDFTLVRLTVLSNGKVRSAGTYALGFPGLTATSGLGAASAGAPPVAAAPALGGGAGACGSLPNCQAQGPLRVQVVGVNVTDSGGVTAHHTVRTTLRIQNIGTEPLILAYPYESAQLTDDQGLSYRWGKVGGTEARYVHGIGLLRDGSVDTSFQLAPGEAREASYESVLQYSTRHTHPGTVFSFDITLAQLALLGNRQVQTQRQYTMNFSNLSATSGLAGLGSGGAGAANAAQAVGQIVNLLKGLGK